MSLGQLVVFKTVRTAGTKIDEAILTHIRKKHNLYIGERTAEEIKMRMGNAHMVPDGEGKKILRSIEVKGRDTQSGLPRIAEIGEESINEALQKPLKQIIEGVKEVLSLSPPNFRANIIEKGIVLSGAHGNAQSPTSILRITQAFLRLSWRSRCFVSYGGLGCSYRESGYL